MSKDTSSDEYLELKTELRSILISSQEGCSEQQLLKEYADYNGHKEIPFRRMGYKSLIELLASMPDVARIDQRRAFVVIHGVADQSTAHIHDFVKKQKRNKKSMSSRGGMARNNFPNRYNPPTIPRMNRPGPVYSYNTGIPFQPYSGIVYIHNSPWDTQYIPKVSNATAIYPMSLMTNDPARQATEQNLSAVAKSSATTETKVASFPPKKTPPLVSSPEITSIRETPIIDDTSSMLDEDGNFPDDIVLAANDAEKARIYGTEINLLRRRIRQLLLKYPSGVWLKSVERMYKKLFDEELSLEAYRLKNLLALFGCISDFVDASRNPLNDPNDRLLVLKPNFMEIIRREQETPEQKPESTISMMNSQEPDNPFRHSTNGNEHSIVDRSSFVPSDFQYKLVECPFNTPFPGFLGDVQDPWNLHIGNKGFIPKRDRMMAELQDHYSQSSDQSIYNIPFEQIQIHLPCVYYHDDQTYYRAFIYHIDPSLNSDIVVLKVHLVDYGRVISNVIYGTNSSSLKFLHLKFSTLSCQIYECRLANIAYPPTSSQWPDDAGQFVADLCEGISFSIEIVGFIDSLYSIYIWIDPECQQSINKLLIQQGMAIESDDSKYAEMDSYSSNPLTTNNSNNYIDERLLSRPDGHALEYDLQESHLKHYVISIEHAYYFVKHPFTKRPCLPCFEVARLLKKDETFVVNLNLVRETEVALKDSTRTLFDALRRLNESIRCPHINRSENQTTIFLYDLSSIRDYLLKIKFQEGDVLDAFQQEYDNYDRPGYWNEKKNSYITDENLQTHQEDLYQQQDLWNFRRQQLVSLSKTSSNISTHNEIQTIDNNLNQINGELHTMQSILPSVSDRDTPLRSISTNQSRISTIKLRETLFRIARPMDQQFSLNIRFQHQVFDVDQYPNEDFEDRLHDLYRITKNVIQFFLLESQLPNENERISLDEVNSLSTDLINSQVSWTKRIEIYNYCVKIIQHFQPIIFSHVQRTDLIDTVY